MDSAPEIEHLRVLCSLVNLVRSVWTVGLVQLSARLQSSFAPSFGWLVDLNFTICSVRLTLSSTRYELQTALALWKSVCVVKDVHVLFWSMLSPRADAVCTVQERFIHIVVFVLCLLCAVSWSFDHERTCNIWSSTPGTIKFKSDVCFVLFFPQNTLFVCSNRSLSSFFCEQQACQRQICARFSFARSVFCFSVAESFFFLARKQEIDNVGVIPWQDYHPRIGKDDLGRFPLTWYFDITQLSMRRPFPLGCQEFRTFSFAVHIPRNIVIHSKQKSC